MTATDGVRVVAEKRVALRPVVVGTVLAVLVALSGALLRAADPQALTALSVVATLVLLSGCARGVLWLLLAGRTRVAASDLGVELFRGRRRVVVPAAEVVSVRIAYGEGWPELSRWALHARIQMVRRDGRAVTAPILLSTTAVVEGSRRLEALYPPPT